MSAYRSSSARRQLLWLLFICVAGRMGLAAVLGLGVDESYEVVLSRQPSLSYFDHPPLSFWIPGLVARIAGSENRVLLRLPFILLFAGTTVLLFRLTAKLYGERAAFLAALLLNITPVFSVSTGSWILPDGPLAFGIVATALCLTNALLHVERASTWRWWLAAGATTGIALLSKYHGVFVLAGTLLFLITQPAARVWLRRPDPYLAAVIALVVATPVWVWNAQHDFASFRFQAGRAATHGAHLTALAQNLGGQLGYLLPWIGILLLWQLARALRTGPQDAPRWLLCCLALWPIGVFTVLSLGGNPGLPHWPAPGYLLLFPFLGDALARYESRGARERVISARALTAAAVVFVALVAVAASDVATGWIAQIAPDLFRHGDPSLEAYDWRNLPEELRQHELLSKPDQIVVATHWIDAAKIGYALGPARAILCLSDDPRGFRYAYPPSAFTGRDGLIVVRVGRGASPVDVLTRYAQYFSSIEAADTVAVRRAGRVEIRLAVFRARNLLGSSLPRITGTVPYYHSHL